MPETELAIVDAKDNHESKFTEDLSRISNDPFRGEFERSRSLSNIHDSSSPRRREHGTSVSLTLTSTQSLHIGQPISTVTKRHFLFQKSFENPVECARFRMRRNALCDPEKMAMPQITRERIQKEVDVRRKSLTRKVTNYFSVHLNFQGEEDLV